MDYCHSCRRHLNGALVCPGCGASAESLRAYSAGHGEQGDVAQESYGAIPETYGTPSGPYEAQSDGYPVRPESYGYHPGQESVMNPVPTPPAPAPGASATSGDDDAGADDEDAHPASGASRRDRKASAHRRRRRRAALIAAGVILLTGGVGLAELGTDAPGSSSGNPAAAGGESRWTCRGLKCGSRCGRSRSSPCGS
ncbi:SCO2400 family protein, partial [Streptomyces sp. S6]